MLFGFVTGDTVLLSQVCLGGSLDIKLSATLLSSLIPPLSESDEKVAWSNSISRISFSFVIDQ